MAAEKVTMSHTFWRKLPFANWEKIDVNVLDWTAGTMPDQFKGEKELLVRIRGTLYDFKLTSGGTFGKDVSNFRLKKSGGFCAS